MAVTRLLGQQTNTNTKHLSAAPLTRSLASGRGGKKPTPCTQTAGKLTRDKTASRATEQQPGSTRSRPDTHPPHPALLLQLLLLRCCLTAESHTPETVSHTFLPSSICAAANRVRWLPCVRPELSTMPAHSAHSRTMPAHYAHRTHSHARMHACTHAHTQRHTHRGTDRARETLHQPQPPQQCTSITPRRTTRHSRPHMRRHMQHPPPMLLL